MNSVTGSIAAPAPSSTTHGKHRVLGRSTRPVRATTSPSVLLVLDTPPGCTASPSDGHAPGRSIDPPAGPGMQDTPVVRSTCQCRRFSMPQWPWTQAASVSGGAAVWSAEVIR